MMFLVQCKISTTRNEVAARQCFHRRLGFCSQGEGGLCQEEGPGQRSPTGQRSPWTETTPLDRDPPAWTETSPRTLMSGR